MKLFDEMQGNDFHCVALCALVEARRPRLRSWVGGFVESLSAVFG